jgi:hypothetical protein
VSDKLEHQALAGTDAASPKPLGSTHTPGPWKFSQDRDRPGAHFITNANGVLVARVNGANIADDPNDYDAYIPGRSDETDANARLIAAAPDLLAALEEIAKGQGAFSRDPIVHAINTIADMKALAVAAIAKAKAQS